MNRRQFLGNMLKTACGVGLVGLGLGAYSKRASSMPANYIRPPGALPEEDFLGACIRCGLCVRDCPYDILFLGEVGDEVATGTPYFIARSGPCEMCEDIPCVVACPTNALDHELKDIEESRMGLAVVIDQENCIAFHGLRCEVCFNVCPIRGRAISLDMQHNTRSGKHALFIPVVHSEACTAVDCVNVPAFWKRLPSRSFRCIWQKASWASITVWAGRRKTKRARHWSHPTPSIVTTYPKGCVTTCKVKV